MELSLIKPQEFAISAPVLALPALRIRLPKMLNVPNVQSYMFLIPTINFADHSASNLLLGIGLHSLAESVLLIKLSHYT